MNALTVIEPQSNVDAFRASTDAASLCKEIVVATAKLLGDRKYVCVEGWQAIAIAHGCTASARAVEKVDGGVRAIGEVRRMADGAVIAEAEGFVGEDEPTWYGGTVTNKWGKTKVYEPRPAYAIRAMAQTRAISRACRSAFAHVVVMMNAGLSTTPAEEVPHGGFDNAASEGEYTEAPRETARQRAVRESEANGGTHPNNMPGADEFDAAAAALRIQDLLKLAQCKEDIVRAWNVETRADRARIKAADPDLYKRLNDTLAFETQRVSSPQSSDILDDEVKF